MSQIGIPIWLERQTADQRMGPAALRGDGWMGVTTKRPRNAAGQEG